MCFLPPGPRGGAGQNLGPRAPTPYRQSKKTQVEIPEKVQIAGIVADSWERDARGGPNDGTAILYSTTLEKRGPR